MLQLFLSSLAYKPVIEAFSDFSNVEAVVICKRGIMESIVWGIGLHCLTSSFKEAVRFRSSTVELLLVGVITIVNWIVRAILLMSVLCVQAQLKREGKEGSAQLVDLQSQHHCLQQQLLQAQKVRTSDVS